LAPFTLEAKAQNVVELSSVTFAEPVVVNDWVEATLTFTNHSKRASKSYQATLGSQPAFLEFDPKAVAVPEMAPGETHAVTVTVRAGVWVGGNTTVGVRASLAEEGGPVVMESL